MSSIATQGATERNMDMHVDPFELQVCKIMIDGILDQLKNGGVPRLK